MRRTLLPFFLIHFLWGVVLGLGPVERREKGNLVLEGIPEIPKRIEARMSQYRNYRSASFQGWHPSGEGLFILTRFSETDQIHWVKQPGGARHQLTYFDEPVTEVAINPLKGSTKLLFSKDVGGSEFYQLYHFDWMRGSSTLLTDGESLNGFPIWSARGDRFVYSSTVRNGRDFDLWIRDPEQSEGRMVLQKGGVWYPVDWSPNDSRVILQRRVSSTESYGYILDADSGELLPINPSEEKISYGVGGFRWARDASGIFLSSNQGSEFRQLRFYEPDTGKMRDISSHIPWDVTDFDLSPDGKLAAFVVNREGIGELHLMDLATNRELPLPMLPIGQIEALEFSPNGASLALGFNTAETPGDVYVFDIQRKQLTRWTYSEVGGLDTSVFKSPKLVHYPTFDLVEGKHREIPCFYYTSSHQGPAPVLIIIHGGPEEQFNPYFSSSIQFYVNEMGIAVLAPNVRGSSGYGKTYLQLDNGLKREDSVRDIGALLDWIGEQPEMDEKRVAVMGASYGGYMVLASMIHFNDRLRAGIDQVGISNFVTFLENTESYRRDLRRVEYGDERDPESRTFLLMISPTTNAKRISKPLFVVQGLNDPAVPVTESEQMVKVIRENDGEVWYLLARDEGHGFRKKRNRDFYHNAVVLFLEKYLVQGG